MKVIPTTEVRSNFQEVIDAVHYTKEPVVIAKRKKAWVLIKPLPENDPQIAPLIEEYISLVAAKKDAKK